MAWCRRRARLPRTPVIPASHTADLKTKTQFLGWCQRPRILHSVTGHCAVVSNSEGGDKTSAPRGRLSEPSLVGPLWPQHDRLCTSLDCGTYRQFLNFPHTSRLQRLRRIRSYRRERDARTSGKLLTGVQPIGGQPRITETPDIWGFTKPRASSKWP